MNCKNARVFLLCFGAPNLLVFLKDGVIMYYKELNGCVTVAHGKHATSAVALERHALTVLSDT